MKKPQPNPADEADMRAEYDFSEKQGMRGKYYQAYQAGHTVHVHHGDGTVSTQYFTLEEGAVLLAPDVRAYFTNSESVNQALRGLIELIPQRKQDLTQTG